MTVNRSHRSSEGGLTALLYNEQFRAIAFQILVLGAIVALGWYLVHNTLVNLEQQSIATGFGFMDTSASFAIGESMIDYTPADSYGRAFLVGILNTIKVSVIGIILATIIGVTVGISRLSTNWLLAKLAAVYVDIFRNVPVLLQLFFWYSLLTESLPHPRQALAPLPGVFLSNRGLMVPVPEPHIAWSLMAAALVVAMIATIALDRWGRKRQAQTGRPFPIFLWGAGLMLGLPLLTWLVSGAPTALDMPALRGFNFKGGTSLSPELTALLLGLVIYTSAFIAENVRAGILGVSKGQWEAGLAIGLSRGQVLRLIVLPQALRIIVPPTTLQYLSLTKNSSLAVAIGYPDVVNVLNTTMNQTGQAIEGVALIMAVYLTISLSIAVFMNWYNKRIALVER